MKKYLVNFVTFLVAGFFLFNFQGCALIGLGTGAIIDNRKPGVPSTEVNTESVQFLEKGTRIEVVNHNGLIYKGTLESYGLERIGSDTIPVLVLMAHNTPMRIAAENIDRIEIPGKKKKAKWIGLGVGMAVDAAFTTVTIVTLKNSKDDFSNAFEQVIGAIFFGHN